jgi:hypothetical protein
MLQIVEIAVAVVLFATELACVAGTFFPRESVTCWCEERANRFRRLRLLRSRYTALFHEARRYRVRFLTEESFKGKHKRDPYDSRGLLLLTPDVVYYWDLGESTRPAPYSFDKGAEVAWCDSEPYRSGGHPWVEIRADKVSWYFQADTSKRRALNTRRIFNAVDYIL